jgi:hypothetical protein
VPQPTTLPRGSYDRQFPVAFLLIVKLSLSIPRKRLFRICKTVAGITRRKVLIWCWYTKRRPMRQPYFLSISCLKKHKRPAIKTAKHIEKEILGNPRERIQWRICCTCYSWARIQSSRKWHIFQAQQEKICPPRSGNSFHKQTYHPTNMCEDNIYLDSSKSCCEVGSSSGRSSEYCVPFTKTQKSR